MTRLTNDSAHQLYCSGCLSCVHALATPARLAARTRTDAAADNARVGGDRTGRHWPAQLDLRGDWRGIANALAAGGFAALFTLDYPTHGRCCQR
jgi:hypothetical protein